MVIYKCWPRLYNKLKTQTFASEGACWNEQELLNSTGQYRTVKSFKSQYFQNYYFAVLSSTIIVIVSSDYLYITSVWGISEFLIVDTCLPAWNDMIGRIAGLVVWMWPMEACDWTTTDSAGIPQGFYVILTKHTHFQNTVNYTKIALAEVCVCESRGVGRS